jgi:transcriptional regulator with XRE-family HTH domain
MSTAAVADNVRRLLDGRTQSTICKRTGWGAQYVSLRMRGEVGWSVQDLVSLCEVFEVDPTTLLTPVAAPAAGQSVSS